MLTKLYRYLEITKNSTLFQKSMTIYNDTIYSLIIFLYKIRYNQSSKELDVQFHEECIYY
jgi:hypothetical protein